MDIENIIRILNEEDINIRLYFTMKKGIRYYTYSPSIDGEVNNKLIELIEKYIAKFTNHEKVEFSPVGYKEGTIETCDCSYVGSYDDVIKTLSEEEVERDEIDDKDINKLNFYCIKLTYEKDNEVKEILMFRRVTKFRKLSKNGMFGTIKNNRFNKIDSDLLGIDGDVDIIIFEGEMLILNHIALERIFSLVSQYEENAKQAIDTIRTADRISNFEQFEEDCLNDRRVTRILTKMLSEDENLENCFENFPNVINVIDIFELDINIDNSEEQEIIMYESKEQLMDVIRLVRDSYYRSIIRERAGIDDAI